MDNPVKMVRGHINIAILKALEEGDKYGYEIGKYIEGKTGGGYKLNQATLYSSLNRLEERDFISSYWGDETDTSGGRRKYFSLTDIGKELASRNITEWKRHREIVDSIIKRDSVKTAGQPSHPAVTGNDGATQPSAVASGIETHLPRENTSLQSDTDTPAASQFLTAKSRDAHSANFDNNPKTNEYKHVLSKLLSGVINQPPENESVRQHDTCGNAAEQSLPSGGYAQENNRAEGFISGERGDNSYADTQQYQQHFISAEQRTEIDRQSTGAQPLKQTRGQPDTADKRFYFDGEIRSGSVRDSAKDGSMGAVTGQGAQGIADIDERDELLESFRQRTGGQTGAQGGYSLLPSASLPRTPFERMTEKLNADSFCVKPYNAERSGKGFLLINKLSFTAMLLLYVVMAAQTLFIYTLFQPTIALKQEYYLYAAGICLIFPLAAAVQYYVDPLKKTKRRFYPRSMIISSIMHFLVAALAITAIALIFDVDTSQRSEYLLKIVVPAIYASNFIFYSIIWSVLYKKKVCFV